MDPRFTAWLFQTGGQIASDTIHLAVAHHFKLVPASSQEAENLPEKPTNLALNTTIDTALTQNKIEPFRKPTTEETIRQLDKRLIRQILRLVEDLLEGARINDIPCDCLQKHTNEMDITAEELQTMSQKPIYQHIRDWCSKYNWGPNEVAKHPKEFFVTLVPELRSMRKAIEGTIPLKPTVLTEPTTEKSKLTDENKPDMAKIKLLAYKVKSGEISKKMLFCR
jgi:hypothetical protein